MIADDDLKNVPVFACVEEEERGRLGRLAADIHLEAGEWLFREREEPHFFVVLEGEARGLEGHLWQGTRAQAFGHWRLLERAAYFSWHCQYGIFARADSMPPRAL